MARNFNGTTDTMLRTASVPVTVTPITVACWFRANDIATQYTLVSISNGVSDSFAIQLRGDITGDPIRANAASGGSSVFADTSTGFSASTWTHACAVFTSSTSRAAYINGGSKGTDASSITPTGIDRIRISGGAAAGNLHAGDIAELAVWTITLTDAEVASLATGISPLLVRPGNLVAYYPIIGRYSPEIDVVGNFNVTLTGTTNAAHVPINYYRQVSRKFKVTNMRRVASGRILVGGLSDITLGTSISPRVDTYRFTTGFGNRYTNPGVLPPDTINGIAFSTNGAYIAGAHSNSPFVTAYSFTNGVGYGTKVADPGTLPGTTGNAIAFSPDGAYVAIASNGTPRIQVYPWNGTFGTKVADPGTLPAGGGLGVTFSPAGDYIAVSHGSSPFISVYPWNGTFGTKISDPPTLPASDGNSVAWHPSSNYIAVSHDNPPRIQVYPWTAGVFGSKFSDPATTIPGAGNSVTFSPDGNFIAVAHNVSPFVSVYEWSAAGFGAKLPNPSTLPAGIGRDVLWSFDGKYIGVAHDSSPAMSIYNWSTSGFGSKLSDPTTLPNGNGRSLFWRSAGNMRTIVV